ncbi:Hypp6340 [Branchiostoma lanceolatum]|uniref:Hypp6340 protein n=1 Tax=Branchiostoma lanceolatum TaxID=7740 RepID=A0A8J9YT87_BRALA|nr:Hypp6340 [Branchiostoma lanceolatum]
MSLLPCSGQGGWPWRLLLCLLVCRAGSDAVPESSSDKQCTDDVEDTPTECLAVPRLHFAGRILADIPTVNNEVHNFNIDKFVFDKDPGFNKMGTGDFRLVNCSVTQVCLTDGSCIDDDPIVGQPIIRSEGKIVDQDPENQFQPVIWGLAIGVSGFFKGDLEPRPVQHFHDACGGNLCETDEYQGDADSGVYVSTLENVVWEEEDESTFMSQVRSLRCKRNFNFHVKMTVYNVRLEPENDDFPYGRVIGTIFATVSESPLPFGPYKRMLWGDGRPPLHHVPFYVDKCRKTVVLDFANSIRSDIHGKIVKPTGGKMYLHQFNGTYTRCSGWQRDRKFTKRIKFGGEEWRRKTSGLIEFTLDDDELKTVDDLPFAVVMSNGDIRNQDLCITLLAEREDGLFVSPVDTFAFRKEPHSSWVMKLGTFRFGTPAAGVVLKPRQYYPKDDPTTVTVQECTADANGICALEFMSYDPGKPRKHNQLDGQVYFFSIRAHKSSEIEAAEVKDLTVFVKAYSTHSYIPGSVTWYNDVYPIFQQYANLYPVMKPIINLASYDDFTCNLRLLEYALTLPESHPNHMPVSRDLSQAKREMILSWLRDTGGGTRLPPLGTAPHGVKDLKKALQTALELELATIPPYLTAMFSLKDGHNGEVLEVIQNVVLDEMKHLTLVANLLNAIGGEPVLNKSSVVLSYPSPLPGGANPGLTVELARCSKNQIRSVFQAIERPDCEKDFSNIHRSLHKLSQRNVHSDDLAQNPEANEILDSCKKLTERPQTIGAMYIHEILCPLSVLTIKTLGGIFKKGDPKKQMSREHWLSDGGNTPFKVNDFRSAMKAIATIVQEGEGSDPCNPLEESGQPSHYFKFAEVLYGKRLVRMNDPQVLLGKCSDRFFPCDDDMKCDKGPGFVFAGRPVPFFQDDVWPIISNPRSEKYRPGSRARKYSDRFNKIFTDILKCLHTAFNGDPAKVKECTGMMKSLTVWAKKLVRTPLDPEGHPNDGPNAAPTFEFFED